jgi:ParB family chromosome partitioning protein
MPNICKRTGQKMSKHPPKRNFKNIALFTAEETKQNNNPVTLSLAKIRLPKTQPRHYFDPEAMESLIASIQKDGILQPILVRPVGDFYELVAGERRFRAASSLELSDIPVVIKEFSDQDAYLIALTENLQREDLNPIEETEGILSLLSLKLEQSEQDVIRSLQNLDHLERGNIKAESKSAHNVMGKKIIEEIFAALGLTWQSFLKNRLPLLNLPEDVMEELRRGKLAYTKAKAIARIKDEQKRIKLLNEAIQQSLSLNQIRERIREITTQIEQESVTPQIRTKELWKQMNKQKPWNWNDKRKKKKWEKIMQQLEELFQEEPKVDG